MMRKVWTGCLGVSLAWGGAAATASEFAAQRATPERPAATLGRPAATLGRPTAVPAAADRQITPVGLSVFGRPQAVEQPAQPPEGTLPAPKPMPSPGDVWGVTRPQPLGQPASVGHPVTGDPTCCGPAADCGACLPESCGLFGWAWGCCPTPPSHFWVSGEYLLWWMRDSRLPPLVTTGTDPRLPGVIGVPGTQVLFGDSKANHDERSGGRFGIGWWFDECHDWGVDANFFFLGQRSVNFLASSGGNPILARPFFDVLNNRQNSQLVAVPGVVAGTVRVELPSRLWGADSNLRHNICRGQCWSLDKLVGFRYLDLHESLTVTEFLATPQQPPSILIVNDRFSARNQFYGGQFGLQYEVRKGRWYVDVVGKVALGATHQVVHIDGTTTFIPAGSTAVTQPGGLLAQRTNSGWYRRHEFSVVPEIGVRLGCQVTPHLRAFVGYNFLYWNNVARPADQIDFGVNPSQISSIFGPGTLVGPARPAFTFRDGDFWVQGISFGLELRF